MQAEHKSILSLINSGIASALKNEFKADQSQIENILKKTTVSIPDDISNGHWTSNIAMVSAGILKSSPRDLANEVIKIFAENEVFEKIEIAGPGFINFFLTSESLLRQTEYLHEQFLETIKHINPRKILIEFVSANPTGPLHVGHGRGAAYGDALKRMLELVGHSVTTEYYVNDAGRQMDIVTASILLRSANISAEDFPSACYQGEYIKAISADIVLTPDECKTIEDFLKDLPADEDEAIDKICLDLKNLSKIWGSAKNIGLQSILGLIKKELSDLGVDFDEWFYESSLGGLDDSSSLLKQALEQSIGTAGYEKEGAYWLRSTDCGDDKDRVLIRRDGRVTYLASDVAYHKNKLDRGFDQLINIWGADHHGYIKRIEAAIESVGYSKSSLLVLLVQFANLYEDGKKLKMSTRSGTYYDLGSLIEMVGADITRFFYLAKQADQHLDFDVSLAKSESKDNLYYYIQYAHARISSLEKKYEDAMGSLPSSVSANECPEALIEIIQILMKHASTLLNSVERHQPHLLIYYLRELSQKIHQFYNEVNVLKASPEEASTYMFVLLQAKQVIDQSLGLLGIQAKEQM